MSEPARVLNVAARLTDMARRMPDAVSVAMPLAHDPAGPRSYRSITFRQLDDDSRRIAAGLRTIGVEQGTRLALLVRPSIDFITLVFALFKAGAVIVLIDPGMGRRHLIRCLDEAAPEGFVAPGVVHLIRRLLPWRFRHARHFITVGRRWFPGDVTLDQLRESAPDEECPLSTTADDPAAIIFTSGSTGPPKGVLYAHGQFDRQVTEIRDQYGIEPGEVDLAAFPLFGLFNSAMGVTTIVPDMDASRPARCRPEWIVEAIQDWRVTQSFASPAVWRRVGEYCESKQIQLPTLRRVLAAGAPVPPDTLATMKRRIASDGEMHTPYGATEALPVATISAREVLEETRARWAVGAGTCVGRRFPGIRWQIIRTDDRPIASLEQAIPLPRGEIGELIVQGPVVTRRYVTRTWWNEQAKIADGDSFWHRMGDVGYLDDLDRFWFCGRKAHRVEITGGTLYTIPCEAIFNQHPAIERSALVGVGPRLNPSPVMICQPRAEAWPRHRRAEDELIEELARLGAQHEHTRGIGRILLKREFPVDVRHNAKIHRESLAVWAARRV